VLKTRLSMTKTASKLVEKYNLINENDVYAR
jgi:hypothetical protein